VAPHDTALTLPARHRRSCPSKPSATISSRTAATDDRRGRAQVDAPDARPQHAPRVAAIAYHPQRAVDPEREPEQAVVGPGLDERPAPAVIARHRELAVLAARPHRVGHRQHAPQAQPARRLALHEVAGVGARHHHPAPRHPAERDDRQIRHREPGHVPAPLADPRRSRAYARSSMPPVSVPQGVRRRRRSRSREIAPGGRASNATPAAVAWMKMRSGAASMRPARASSSSSTVEGVATDVRGRAVAGRPRAEPVAR
jgi:hypothetical protein